MDDMTYPPQGGYGQPGYGYPSDPNQSPYGQQGYSPQQPPYPQQTPQPPPNDGSTGWLRIDAQFFWLAWVLFFVKPVIIINGQQMPNTQWGQNVFPLPAGQHHVVIYFPWLFPAQPGRAEQWVTIHPGQPLDLEYRAPLWVFSPGSFGPAPQQYNGLGILIGIYAVVFILILLSCLVRLSSPYGGYYYY